MKTKKKNQHYVPKFYLRNFSVKNNQKQIALYNFRTAVYVPQAAIKNQGSKNYFYGEDGQMEDNLGVLENAIAPSVHKLIKGEIPKTNSEDHYSLLCFLITSERRNPLKANLLDQLQDKMFKQIFGKSEEFKDHINDFTIHMTNSVGASLSMAKAGMDFCIDLRFKIIHNRTNIPFITSDNPVIKYNQFLEYHNFPGGHTGYGSAGLQILMPISPEFLIIFYDESLYLLGGKKQKIVPIESPKEIDQLNLLQCLNCTDSVFFNELIEGNYITELFERAKQFDRPDTALVDEYLNAEDSNKSLIHSKAIDLKTNLDLSFIAFTNKAASYKFSGTMAEMRKWPEILRKMQENKR